MLPKHRNVESSSELKKVWLPLDDSPTKTSALLVPRDCPSTNLGLLLRADSCETKGTSYATCRQVGKTVLIMRWAALIQHSATLGDNSFSLARRRHTTPAT